MDPNVVGKRTQRRPDLCHRRVLLVDDDSEDLALYSEVLAATAMMYARPRRIAKAKPGWSSRLLIWSLWPKEVPTSKDMWC
jgi:hypothetical protein